jgi:hypothetical protein
VVRIHYSGELASGAEVCTKGGILQELVLNYREGKERIDVSEICGVGMIRFSPDLIGIDAVIIIEVHRSERMHIISDEVRGFVRSANALRIHYAYGGSDTANGSADGLVISNIRWFPNEKYPSPCAIVTRCNSTTRWPWSLLDDSDYVQLERMG